MPDVTSPAIADCLVLKHAVVIMVMYVILSVCRFDVSRRWYLHSQAIYTVHP